MTDAKPPTIPNETDADSKKFIKEMAPFQEDIVASSKAAKETERELIAELVKNIRSSMPIVDVEIEGNSLKTTVRKSNAHNRILHSAVIAKAFGVKDLELSVHQLNKLLNASIPKGNIDTATYNSTLNVMHELAPADPVEGMLASQMVAVHSFAMETMRRALNAERIPAFESYTREANRLMRTFSTQVETLKRYRAKASQTVRVERVYVNEGGQAIVGDVHHQGGGDKQKSKDQYHAKQVAHAPEPEMRCEDTQRDTVPVTGTKGKKSV